MSVSAVRAMAARRKWWAALLVALALTGALAPRAGAVLVHWGPKGSKAAVGLLPRLGIKPASIPGNFARHSASSTVSSSDKGTLVYHGGPVLHASAPYLIFWDPNGEITTSEKAHLEQYFVDTANDSQILPAVSSNIFGVDRQYTDTTGFADYTQAWSLSHAITDPQAYPSAGQCDVSSRVPVGTCLFDSQIQSEVARVINARSLPTGTSGSAPIYFVVTPPSVDTCNDGGITVCADNFYCAYHGIFSSSGHDILYADMPTYLDFHDPKGCQSDGNTQVQAPNGDQITDVVTSSMSHEFSETITDPITDSSLGKGGWYDPISGNEDGDNCAFIGTPSDPVDPAKGYSPDAFAPTLGGSASAGTLYDQLINGGHYYTQTEWSNGNLDCEAKPATATLSAAFSAPPTAAPDTAVSFDGAGSSSSAGYSSTTWDFGDVTTAFATGGPSQITHYFRANGTFHVTLTVVDAYGNLNESAPQTVTVSGIGAYFP
ncbi:MAG: PKD domain-containing protein, partial [Solirubrobacteraceae bacterium]